MLTVLGPFLAVAGLSLWLNRLDAVECRGKGFDPLVDGTPLLLVSLLYSGMLCATGRSFFSALLVAGGALLLFAVNRLKLSHFKEPLLFVDFGLFIQMIRHPRFYLPYIFPLPVMISVFVIVGGMVLLYRVQPPLAAGMAWLPRIMLALSLLPAMLLAFRFGPIGRHWVRGLVDKRRPTFDSKADFARFGLTGSLLLHSLAHVHRESKGGQEGALRPRERSPFCVWPVELLKPLRGDKPHVVMVQAESYFDFRRVDASVDPDIYTEFDRLRRGGCSGELEVAAHGAYTMRTEFSVLTGIPNERLGSDSMNPYLAAKRRPVWSLAAHFRDQGYRTVCIHPHDERFFRRDKVMPNLGFDELHGEGLFSTAKRVGPYVGDDALADYVLDLLNKSDKPVFVFAITIEAHGPWDERRFSGMDSPPKMVAAPPWGGTELSVYLTHLRNTDRMIGKLATSDGVRSRVFCVYGDHVGCVPEGRLDSSNTDFLVWPCEKEFGDSPVKAEELGNIVLRKVLESAKSE